MKFLMKIVNNKAKSGWKSIQKYIRENFSIITKIAIIYAIGIIIGIILFMFTDIKNDYANIVKGVLDNTKLDNFQGINIISNGIKNTCTGG